MITRAAAVNKPERWLSLFRLLGFLGFIAALFPSQVRESTGRQRLDLKDGSALIGSMQHSAYAPGFYSARVEESRGAELYSVTYYAALRKTAGADGDAVAGGELSSGRLIKKIAEQEVESYGTKQTYWKVRTLAGIEGFLPASAVAQVKSGANLNIAAEDVSVLRDETKFNLAAAAAWPFRILILFNVYLLLYLPGVLFSIVYLLSAAFVYPLSLLHALVLQRNNEELDHFFRRLIQNQFKLGVALAGWTNSIPHVDVYGQEKNPFPAQAAMAVPESMDRAAVLMRVLLPYALLAGLWYAGKGLDSFGFFEWTATLQFPAFFMYVKKALSGLVVLFLLYSFHFGGPHFLRAYPHILVLALMALGHGGSCIAQWAAAAATGRAIEPVSRFQLHYWKCKASVQAACFGLTAELPSLRELVSGGEESEGAGAPQPKLSMNLLVLSILLAVSGGLYGFFWLARVARLMSDDAFTIVVTSVAGGLLPLSFIFSRYYRRAEMLTKMNPGVLIEILMIVPGANLVLGPFVIQYLLNHYERMKAQPA